MAAGIFAIWGGPPTRFFLEIFRPILATAEQGAFVDETTVKSKIAAAVAGDTEALTALLHHFGPDVERSLQINPVWQPVLETSDVMQVTYLEAFLRISRFDPDRSDSFVAWLRRVAQNNLRDAIRGLERQKQPQPRNRIRPANHQDSMVGLYEMLEAESGTPSRQVRRDEACQVLESAIRLLPDRYGEVVRRYDLEAQTIQEVAEAMGRSPGAIHMLRARAHERLRQQMGSPSDYLDTRE